METHTHCFYAYLFVSINCINIGTVKKLALSLQKQKQTEYSHKPKSQVSLNCCLQYLLFVILGKVGFFLHMNGGMINEYSRVSISQ